MNQAHPLLSEKLRKSLSGHLNEPSILENGG